VSFEDTTRKMADEVAAEALRLKSKIEVIGPRPLTWEVAALCDAVEKLARCVARRFPAEDGAAEMRAVASGLAQLTSCDDDGNP
jgi:hypothetical protein